MDDFTDVAIGDTFDPERGDALGLEVSVLTGEFFDTEWVETLGLKILVVENPGEGGR